jgi:hypothetical protein
VAARELQNPADRRGVYSNSRYAEAAVEQNLGERPTERMADDNRRIVELADQRVVMVDDLRYAEVLDGRRVATKRCNVLHARPTLGDDTEAPVRVTRYPVLPAERCHEEPMNQDDRIWLVHSPLLARELLVMRPG